VISKEAEQQIGPTSLPPVTRIGATGPVQEPRCSSRATQTPPLAGTSNDPGHGPWFLANTGQARSMPPQPRRCPPAANWGPAAAHGYGGYASRPSCGASCSNIKPGYETDPDPRRVQPCMGDGKTRPRSGGEVQAQVRRAGGGHPDRVRAQAVGFGWRDRFRAGHPASRRRRGRNRPQTTPKGKKGNGK